MQIRTVETFQVNGRWQWGVGVETRACAVGYYPKLISFDFNFLLEVFYAILPNFDLLFNILQQKISDVGYCKKKIDDFLNDLTTLRDSFNEVWHKIGNLSELWETLCPKRLRLNDIASHKKSCLQTALLWNNWHTKGPDYC